MLWQGNTIHKLSFYTKKRAANAALFMATRLQMFSSHEGYRYYSNSDTIWAT